LDVSISVDIHTNNLNKRKKYEPIADWFLKNYKDTKFIHINVNHEYTNLQEELEKIKKEKIVINEFDYNSFYRVVDIINDKKDWVNQNIDKEIFNLLKQKEYNTPVVDDYSNLDARILFLNELKYENIGQYDDLDIDKNIFDEFNSKFKHLEEIKESEQNFKEKELIDYLKNILEQKNDIYSKYKDEKLTSNQFEMALKEIEEKNNNMSKRNPKPTHHLMIPFSCDIIKNNETETIIEQNLIQKFMTDFNKNMENYTETDKNEKFYFIRDLFKEIIWSMEKSDDKEHNCKMFTDRNEYLTDEKQKYQRKGVNRLFKKYIGAEE